jgi:hypothetical protein
MRTKDPGQAGIPPIMHLVNFTALFMIGVILLMSGVVNIRSLIILLPVLGLAIVYWRFHMNPKIVSIYLGISTCLLLWILLCENILRIENLTGRQFTEKLIVGLRLQADVDESHSRNRQNYTQQCCDDPLAWNYKPNSKHRSTYDCSTCNETYQTIVDETGFLNRALGLMTNNDQIEMFVAGDGVLQGIGSLSVIDLIRSQIPVKMWNLSVSGYGPRQRISALLANALDKRPKWLVVEFYARNDVSDAIADALCDKTEDYRCRFSTAEVRYRIIKHPVYRNMVDGSADIFETLAYYASQDFTLAITRYFIDTVKTTIKHALAAGVHGLLSGDEISGTEDAKSDAKGEQAVTSKVVFLAPPGNTYILKSKWLDWVTAGMAEVHRSYERLVAVLAEMESKPAVILLYNPTPYELYRDIRAPRNPEYDRIAEFQREAQKTFAQAHGWRFLDLTEPLRHAIQTHRAWLYGRHDPSHWSSQGTELVATVLRAELVRVMAIKNGSGNTL